MVEDNSPWEDGLLERKTENDLKDLLKTMIAFANSVRPGHVAKILIGERDDGTPQGVVNPDKIQKKVGELAKEIYPSLETVTRTRVYEREGKSCVEIAIEYSGETPHFGGRAWIRRGSESVRASDELFQKLIDYRSALVRELAKAIGKHVTIEREDHPHPAAGWLVPCWFDPAKVSQHGHARIEDVNQFWVTFSWGQQRYSEPLKRISLAWDHNSDNDQLKVLIDFSRPR